MSLRYLASDEIRNIRFIEGTTELVFIFKQLLWHIERFCKPEVKRNAMETPFQFLRLNPPFSTHRWYAL